MKNLKFLSMIVVFLCVGIISCGDQLSDSEITPDFSIENFMSEAGGDEDTSAARRSGNRGGSRGTCIDLVYPLSLTFDDGSTATYDDRESMKEGVSAYKEANPEAERPSLVYPLTVVDGDGNETELSTAEELSALKAECRGDRGGSRGGNKCFQLVYPITIAFEDGTTGTYEDKASKKSAVREYKAANPEAESPTLVYPVTVVDGEENETVVASQEEMDALKEACKADRSDDDEDSDEG